MREYDFPLRQQLTTRSAARYLGFRPDTLRRWRKRGCGPRYVQYGRSIRYDQGDLDTWKAVHAREPGRSSVPGSSRSIVHINELRLTART